MIVCSILLDARSAGAGLPRRLAALKPLRQRHDLRMEVVLADDTDDPRLLRLASGHDARIVTTEGTPLGDRLNTAVAHSQGQALLFLPRGRAIPAGWLVKALVDIEKHSRDAVVLTTSSPSRLRQLWQRLRHQTPADTLCVSRAWFERIGGCDPALDAEALPDLIERLHACQARITAAIA
ncbi:glycosyltransferase family A protein [Halomonas rhizosphaerae]|uniref:Glycosyltransferase family A protein n=1 Tax=Halomonas rhizosphaerae TaxID=3043296 RepID=A0ABT6UYQ2_9GAMM|nr:glycosyltransferase family A protein [Halomonas rhizosphaerae]MDI5891084.1 glycosyltransferase family A protein [Halomonas rhizosphaerae]MDI5919507.1 glycosyltransferase family A protein [Halomonas rhizosphaerae]